MPTSSPDGLIRLARGCWAPPAAAHDLALTCAELLTTSAPDTVVVSITAARLHGLWLPPDLPDVVHLATCAPDRMARHMTRTRRPEIAAHRRRLPAEDRAVHRGVPLTTLARTWRDLAPLLGLAGLVAAGDRALQVGVTLEELADVVARTRRHAGARRAAAALPLLDARSRSRPESHLRVAVSTPELPPFAVNEPIYRDEGGWLAEPDLSLVEARLALEYQGVDHADPQRLRRDITRTGDLRRERWLALLFGPAEVFGRPHQVRLDVLQAVQERAPHLIRRPLRRRVVG